jgi:protein-S-isoprenylcysteine O-methyltransferase Ste14
MFGFLYSLLSYVGFLAIFSYFAWFSDGIGVPRSVDGGSGAPLSAAIAVDLGLLLLFGLQHSVMARAGWKRALTRVLPVQLERSTFVLVSSLTLALLMWQWQPLEGVLWSVESGSAAAVLWTINALGWLGVPVSSLMIDHFDLFGLKQTFQHFRRESFARRGFVTPLVYKYVRHPMMTSLLVGLWVTPHMSLSHLLLSVGMTAYVIIGVHFEERALVRELGSAYERYQSSTPKFFPVGKRATTPPERVSQASV